MTIFEAVKSTVTLRMAAEHYGMTVARNGMVCCPFHNDRHPSMKLNEDYFYTLFSVLPSTRGRRSGISKPIMNGQRRNTSATRM